MGTSAGHRPVLILQQLPCEPPALLADVFREHGWHCETVMVREQSLPASLQDCAGVVIMGGPQSANDDHLPHIQSQLDLLRLAIAQHVPLLGVCLGAQLLARAAGAKVLPSPVRELGWYPIYPTPETSRDRMFASLPEEGLQVFQWHGETFDLPDGSALLATNPDVPNQAFRLGRSQYGLQFHVEVTEPVIRSWLDIGKDEREHLGEEGIKHLLEMTEKHLPSVHAYCRKMATAWLAQLQ